MSYTYIFSNYMKETQKKIFFETFCNIFMFLIRLEIVLLLVEKWLF